MNTPLELVLSKFPEARQVGKSWSARCPCHEDRHPSLSISEGDDGSALLYCHAGCVTSKIVAAIGLQMSDLFLKDAKLPKQRGKAAAPAFKSANDAIKALETKQGKCSAMWFYHNIDREQVGVVIRWDLTNGEKDIRPVSCHPDGWRITAMPSPRPLYCLPEVVKSECVIVTEGEKAAEAARSIGFTATTSAGGSNAAKQTDWKPLAGKEVWILPDNDKSGRKYAEDVVGFLANLEPRPVVRIVELPGLSEKGDIVDWIDNHGDAAEPETMRDEIEALANEVEPWRPDKLNACLLPTCSEGPVVVCLADVESKPVDWLWEGRIPLGRISLLVGFPGEGKSFLTTDMASRISTGTNWPDNANCPKGSVILICAEDNPSDTIRPRLDAHLADCKNVHLLTMVKRTGRNKHHEILFSLADIEALETALQSVPDCKLLIIDPIGSFLGGKVDAHRDNEVRGVLAPVAALAEKHNFAVLVVCHRNKSRGNRADDLALGSRAFTGIARSVWHLCKDKTNKSRRLFLSGKNNLAQEGDGLAFTITGNPPAIVWESNSVQMNADEALAQENTTGDDCKPGPEPIARNAARVWLETLLAKVSMTVPEIKQVAKDAGISWRTIQRAAEEVGIVRSKDQFSGNWRWSLPVDSS